MDENAIILRREVWFNPPIAPTSADIIVDIIINVFIFLIDMAINIIGAIFCQVIRINLFTHVNPSITLGNQKWKGAAPVFIIRADIIIIVDDDVSLLTASLIILDFIAIIKIETSNTEEAKACVRKYFIAASADIRLLLAVIRGINASRLISSPIHALSHEFEDTDKIVPVAITIRNIIFEELLNIKKKRIINLYIWGMNPLA